MSNQAQLRKRAALTQVQLAKEAGITAPRLCLWERGEIELRPEQVNRIAEILAEHIGRTPVFEGVRELAMALKPASPRMEVVACEQ